MNVILETHLELAKKSGGTSTGIELLHLSDDFQYNFAGNTYMCALQEIIQLRRVAGELATDAHALGVAVYDLFDEMATDHSIDIGDVEPKLQSAYGALAEALAAWDALTNGGAK
jgi:hypothetical protein